MFNRKALAQLLKEEQRVCEKNEKKKNEDAINAFPIPRDNDMVKLNNIKLNNLIKSNKKAIKECHKNYKKKLRVPKKNCFDYSEFDERDIQDYLDLDQFNVVMTLLLPNGMEESVCTNYDQIYKQANENKDQIFFECNNSLRRNVNKRTNCYTQLTFPNTNVLVPQEILNLIMEVQPNRRIFVWEEEPIVLKETITLAAALGLEDSYVGASHCQNGTQRSVYNLGTEPYEQNSYIPDFSEFMRDYRK